jgi:hypothetical protein
MGVSVRKSSKLLCQVCLEVQVMKEAANGRAHLVCGHERTTGLLPPAGVSLEHRTTEQGYRLFPAVNDGIQFKERWDKIVWF